MDKNWVKEIEKIANRAVQKAIEENRRKGIPNVFEVNGEMVFEFPDGTRTTDQAVFDEYIKNYKPPENI